MVHSLLPRAGEPMKAVEGCRATEYLKQGSRASYGLNVKCLSQDSQMVVLFGEVIGSWRGVV